MTRNRGRIYTPLREPLKQLITPIITSNRRNGAHGDGESMKMISDIKWCAAGKRAVREKIPKHFTKTKHRSIHQKCGHHQAGVSRGLWF